MPILNREFNAVVKHIGSLVPHTLTGGDYKDFADMKADFARTGRIKINVNNSTGTIFGDPVINWLFRAWHDHCHILADADFTLDGEARAAAYMIGSIQRALPDVPIPQLVEYARIILCEVNGQGEYFATYGEFPIDQHAFSVHYLKTGKIPAKQN